MNILKKIAEELLGLAIIWVPVLGCFICGCIFRLLGV